MSELRCGLHRHAVALATQAWRRGTRTHALHFLATKHGGRRSKIIFASALALAEGAPPAGARPEAGRDPHRRRARSRRPGRGARARRLRARRAGRGARPVRRARRHRRRVPVDRPRAAPRSSSSATRSSPIRAFSPFTQRALHAVDEARRLSGRRAAPRPRRADARRTTRTAAPRRRRRTSCRCSTSRPTSSGRPDEVLRGRARGARRRARPRVARRALDPLPAGPAVRVRGAAAGARRARARPRPSASWARSSVPGSASSSPSRTAARRCARRRCSAGSRPSWSTTRRKLPREPGLAFAVSPARRGFVWRELGLALLPDTQVFRKRAAARRRAGSAARSSRSPTCAPATTSSTRTTASASCSASRRRRSPASRATTSSSRSAARTASTSRTSRSARSRATSAPTRSAPALSKLGGKAWQLRQDPRPRRRPRARRRAARALRAAPAAPRASPYDLENDWLRAARGRVPVPRDGGPAARDRGRQGGPRGAAADGPPRLRRRRLRQDGGRRARRVRRRGQRQADAHARADDDPRAAALEHLPRALPRLPGPRRDGLALPQAGRGEAGARATSPRARSTS